MTPHTDPHHEWQPVGQHCPHGLPWRITCVLCSEEHDATMTKLLAVPGSIRAALAQAVDVMRRSDADYCASHQVAQTTDAEWDAALEAAEDAMEGGDGQE